jgi:hypothetical protein
MRDLLMWLVERDERNGARLSLVGTAKTLREARRAFGKAFDLIEVGPEGCQVGKHHVAIHLGGLMVGRGQARLALGSPGFLAERADKASVCIVDARWPVPKRKADEARPVPKDWLWTRVDGAVGKFNRIRSGDSFDLQ